MRFDHYTSTTTIKASAFTFFLKRLLRAASLFCAKRRLVYKENKNINQYHNQNKKKPLLFVKKTSMHIKTKTKLGSFVFFRPYHESCHHHDLDDHYY